MVLAVVAFVLVLAVPFPLRPENAYTEAPDTGSTVTFRLISLLSMIGDTAILQDSSSKVRPGHWADGLIVLRKYPAGMGLGTTGQTAARFGVGEMGNEAGYLKTTGALGYPGLIVFLAWFLGVIIFSLAISRSFDGLWQELGVLTLVTAVGFLINNLTVPPDQSLFLSYIFPWLAGMTVRRSSYNAPRWRS